MKHLGLGNMIEIRDYKEVGFDADSVEVDVTNAQRDVPVVPQTRRFARKPLFAESGLHPATHRCFKKSKSSAHDGARFDHLSEADQRISFVLRLRAAIQ
jgi:hypothetical protein